MNKVFLDGFVYGRKITGLERHFDKFLEVLLDLKGDIIDDITVITPNLTTENAEFKTIRIKPLFFNFIYFIIAHRKIKQCDIYIGVSGIFPLFMPKSVKNRVLIVHDLFWYDNRLKSFKSYVYFKLFDISIRQASKLIAISASTKNELVSKYPACKDIDVLPNFLELNICHAVKNNNPKQFLSVGLNSERKSPLLCYEIAKYFYDNYGFIWKIVGLTPSLILKYQKAGIKICDEPFVEIVENVNDDQLYQLYSECHFTFILSETEGFCYPILEAQAHRCIPILSKLDVLKEVAGERVFEKSSFELDFKQLIGKLEFLLFNENEKEEIINYGLQNLNNFSRKNTRNKLRRSLQNCKP